VFEREIFPKNYFKIQKIGNTSIPELLPISDESKRLLDWIDVGIKDALEKKYVRALSLNLMTHFNAAF
jgi:hypothetical protein